ncbi:MAG: nitrile hydratase subunit beta [Alphaproteobacteria bacterium]|jgi:hypothetical protein|nr:nitrile hydratase subunit beta [Alphaproteobacteria bacterium]
MSEDYRGYHDLGGLAGGAVDRHEHDSVLWEKRIDALMMLLSDTEHRIIRVDELRRAIESLGAQAYEELGYYERWVSAIANLLTEKGILGEAEIEARIADLKARGEGLA